MVLAWPKHGSTKDYKAWSDTSSTKHQGTISTIHHLDEMPIRLPHDVWHVIASFLPSTTVIQLYGVCPALFDLAMDEIYKEGKIYSFTLEKKKRIRMFDLSSSNAKRVRKLTLHPLLELPPRKTTIPSNLWIKYDEIEWKLRRSFNKETPLPVPHFITKVFVANIRLMENVTSLNIVSSPSHDNLRPSLSLLEPSWETFGKNLSCLMISLPLEEIVGALAASPLMPFLDDLSIDLKTAYPTTDYSEIYSTTLLPFIHRHKGTLRSLAFGNPPTTHTVDPSNLFLCMENVRFLERLSITYPIRNSCMENPGFKAILSTYAQQLRTLKFSLNLEGEITSPSAESFMATFFSIRFPQLKELDLELFAWDAQYWTRFVELLSGYLKPMYHSLTSLTIQNYRFTDKDLASTLSASGTPLFSCLEQLTVCIHRLCPKLLGILRQSLPNICHLNIEYDLMVDAAGLDARGIYVSRTATHALRHYLTQVKEHRLQDWSLRYLAACCKRGGDEGADAVHEYILTRAFPSAVIFNGSARRAIVASCRYPPQAPPPPRLPASYFWGTPY